MKRSLIMAAALCCLVITSHVRGDERRSGGEAAQGEDDGQGRAATLAVFGDWPYSLDLVAVAPLLIDSIIHSGSMPCTGAGQSPLPAGSNPIWNYGVFGLFGQFRPPLVYTPGDNEWTDCHKKKEFSSGAPLRELAAVRELFFPEPGVTLGGERKLVLSAAGRSVRSPRATTATGTGCSAYPGFWP
jgi:hypothetical protein